MRAGPVSPPAFDSMYMMRLFIEGNDQFRLDSRFFNSLSGLKASPHLFEARQLHQPDDEADAGGDQPEGGAVAWEGGFQKRERNGSKQKHADAAQRTVRTNGRRGSRRAADNE